MEDDRDDVCIIFTIKVNYPFNLKKTQCFCLFRASLFSFVNALLPQKFVYFCLFFYNINY